MNLNLIPGWLSKRSERKFLLGPPSFKMHWFTLTRTSLSFQQNPKAKKYSEKDRILLSNIAIVEKVVLRESNERCYTFQLVYFESYQQFRNKTDRYFISYLIAKTAQERDDWIEILRSLVKKNAQIAEKYHPGFWDDGKWFCCGSQMKGLNSGCKQITWSQESSEPSIARIATPCSQKRSTLPRIRSDFYFIKIIFLNVATTSSCKNVVSRSFKFWRIT